MEGKIKNEKGNIFLIVILIIIFFTLMIILVSVIKSLANIYGIQQESESQIMQEYTNI